MAEQITSEALNILTASVAISAAKNEMWHLRLTCGQIEPRSLYDAVNEILTRLGGKWQGGKVGAHLFSHDPTAMLIGIVETGIMPPKNPLAFFATPSDLVDEMLEIAKPLLNWGEVVRILEPSAGQGAIADGIKVFMQEACRYDGEAVSYTLDLVEIDPLQCRILNYKDYEVQERDFLTFTPTEGYDLILMNPPFAVKGDKQAYMTHIYRAWELLKPEGRLIAITPTSFLHSSDKKSNDFLQFVAMNGSHNRNGKGRFKDSGTDIDTCLVVLDKTDTSWRSKPREGEGSFSWNVWCLLLHFDNDAPSCDQREAKIKAILAGKYG